MSSPSEVFFDSGGVRCAAHLYAPPAGLAPGGSPCVVMGHGFTGTRNLGLPAYAERFAAAGMAVLVFDYANFGDSGGTPRQVLDVRRQLDDYRAAVAFARALPGIDPGRIALWGTSLSGGHVITVAAGDPLLAAVVAQIPFTKIEAGGDARPAGVALRLLAAVLGDGLRALLRLSPRLIPVIGEPGEPAVFTDPHDKAILDKLAEGAPEWRNAVAARVLFPLLRYDPAPDAARLAMPLLVCLAERDTAASPARAADLARRAPRGETLRYPISHFDAYLGEWFEVIVADQIRFLATHLGLTRPDDEP